MLACLVNERHEIIKLPNYQVLLYLPEIYQPIDLTKVSRSKKREQAKEQVGCFDRFQYTNYLTIDPKPLQCVLGE